ncbi:hypothetical protein AM10699_61530 (plasmid) [Acaryochloris marina MBIC10699]|nr:hypothetical protein AM10699_61530 [Acaryochloris marina MBIC10699]
MIYHPGEDEVDALISSFVEHLEYRVYSEINLDEEELPGKFSFRIKSGFVA